MSEEKTDTKIHKAWFKQLEKELLKLIKLRNTAFKTYHNIKNKSNKQHIKQTKINLKWGKYKAKKDWLFKKVDEINNLQRIDPGTSWKAIKEVRKGLFACNTKRTNNDNKNNITSQKCRIHIKSWRTQTKIPDTMGIK